MRRTHWLTALALLVSGGVAFAGSAEDSAFANAALRALHQLAIESARFQQASKNSDVVGCSEAHDAINNAAHVALANLHNFSFEPTDAIESVSSLLEVNALFQNCDGNSDLLPIISGQAIVLLRADYSIGAADWYTVNSTGQVEAKNPISFAQSLRDQSYSWVSVRPKDVTILLPDWDHEMASQTVDDSTIENSGGGLTAVEVGYRSHSGDENSYVYFYRSKEDALAQRQSSVALANGSSNLVAVESASKAEWSKRFFEFPNVSPSSDPGFKVSYGLCKSTGQKNAIGADVCADSDNYDWSNTPSMPYSWFADLASCQDEIFALEDAPPISGGADETFHSECVPAPKPVGRKSTGYKMELNLNAPDAPTPEDSIYAEWRESGSTSPTIYTTFEQCQSAIDSAMPKLRKYLGVDDRYVLNADQTKMITLFADCVHAY